MVVPSKSLVHNLGQAYPLIDIQAARFWPGSPVRPRLRTSSNRWSSEPTERTRSLTVFLVDELSR